MPNFTNFMDRIKTIKTLQIWMVCDIALLNIVKHHDWSLVSRHYHEIINH